MLPWPGPGIQRRPACSPTRGGCRSSPGWAGCSLSGGLGDYDGCGLGPGGCSHWLEEGCKCWQGAEACMSWPEGCRHWWQWLGCCNYSEVGKVGNLPQHSEVGKAGNPRPHSEAGKVDIRRRCKMGWEADIHEEEGDIQGQLGETCRKQSENDISDIRLKFTLYCPCHLVFACSCSVCVFSSDPGVLQQLGTRPSRLRLPPPDRWRGHSDRISWRLLQLGAGRAVQSSRRSRQPLKCKHRLFLWVLGWIVIIRYLAHIIKWFPTFLFNL